MPRTVTMAVHLPCSAVRLYRMYLDPKQHAAFTGSQVKIAARAGAGFWAVTVGTNMARATPFLGHEGPFGHMLGMTPYNDVRFGLLGGSIVDANALLRSYIWHCIGIPIVASVLMIVHFWRVRKDGGISGPASVVLESEIKEARR